LLIKLNEVKHLSNLKQKTKVSSKVVASEIEERNFILIFKQKMALLQVNFNKQCNILLCLKECKKY